MHTESHYLFSTRLQRIEKGTLGGATLHPKQKARLLSANPAIAPQADSDTLWSLARLRKGWPSEAGRSSTLVREIGGPGAAHRHTLRALRVHFSYSFD